jgi:hypothetical protein
MGTTEKVGLVVHYSASNYGNHLVNYAAKTVLEKCGQDVQIIVFTGGEKLRSRARRRRLPAKLLRLIADGEVVDRVIGRLRSFLNEEGGVRPATANERRLQAFREFGNLYLQPVFVDVAERHDLTSQYASFAVGSDQIWNYDYALGPWHFLDFAGTRRTVCISPSVGHDSIPQEWRGFFRRYLSRFEEVGVRELSWVASLLGWAEQPAFRLLIDPTLAVSVSDWETMARPPRESGGLLLYELGDLGREERQLVSDIAANHELTVRHLSGAVQGDMWETNAADFLGMVQSSDCIVTDSYHGAIFAFLFDKPLVILRRRGIAGSMNSRIETLVEELGLADRMSDVIDAEEALVHDYRHGRESLARLRSDFWAYLAQRGMRSESQSTESGGS